MKGEFKLKKVENKVTGFRFSEEDLEKLDLITIYNVYLIEKQNDFLVSVTGNRTHTLSKLIRKEYQIADQDMDFQKYLIESGYITQNIEDKIKTQINLLESSYKIVDLLIEESEIDAENSITPNAVVLLGHINKTFATALYYGYRDILFNFEYFDSLDSAREDFIERDMKSIDYCFALKELRDLKEINEKR